MVDQATIAAEMRRTTVLKTVVLPLRAREIVALSQEFFREHGYRALPASSPNQVMVRGGREGLLPSVIGEVSVQEKQTVKGRTSVVSLSGYGERLGPQMIAFFDLLRAERQRVRAAVTASATDSADEADEADEEEHE
jgi:hypothetical protein